MIETDSYSDEYKFLEAIKPLETWLIITGKFDPWYHKCGDYFQIDLYGLALDGCGSPYRCTLALTVGGDKGSDVDQYRNMYSKGSLHHITSTNFYISEVDVRFYRFETRPAPVEYESALRNWIDSHLSRNVNSY